MWNASFSTRQFVNQWQEIVSEFHYYKQFEKEEASSVVYETNVKLKNVHTEHLSRVHGNLNQKFYLE